MGSKRQQRLKTTPRRRAQIIGPASQWVRRLIGPDVTQFSDVTDYAIAQNVSQKLWQKESQTAENWIIVNNSTVHIQIFYWDIILLNSLVYFE